MAKYRTCKVLWRSRPYRSRAGTFHVNNVIMGFPIRDALCQLTWSNINILHWYLCHATIQLTGRCGEKMTLKCQRSRSQRRNMALEKVPSYLKNYTWENFHIFFWDTPYNTLSTKRIKKGRYLIHFVTNN